MVLAVTAPGQDVLPWDEAQCRELGPHVHSGTLGCHVARYAAAAWNLTTSARWRRLHRRVYQAVRRHGVRPVLLARVFEKQRRGVLHVHPVLGFKTPAERHAAHLYALYLAEVAGQYGFGFSERKLASRSPRRVAAYLSSYLRSGQEEQALVAGVGDGSGHAPLHHPRFSVLTQATGVTMRELRFRRFVWFIADRATCPLDQAREIATQAVAGTLDLTADLFLPSPRFLAQVHGREPPAAGSVEVVR